MSSAPFAVASLREDFVSLANSVEPFEITFSHLGVFPGKDPVLFLGVTHRDSGDERAAGHGDLKPLFAGSAHHKGRRENFSSWVFPAAVLLVNADERRFEFLTVIQHRTRASRCWSARNLVFSAALRQVGGDGHAGRKIRRWYLLIRTKESMQDRKELRLVFTRAPALRLAKAPRRTAPENAKTRDRDNKT
jgi:hypothetical protein